MPEDTKNAILRFRYELNQTLNTEKDISFRLKPDVFFLTSDNNLNPNLPYSGLDFTLVAVEPMSIDGSIPISSFPFVRLDGGPGKIVEGEGCIVIQHPQGDYKKIVLRLILTRNSSFHTSEHLYLLFHAAAASFYFSNFITSFFQPSGVSILISRTLYPLKKISDPELYIFEID